MKKNINMGLTLSRKDQLVILGGIDVITDTTEEGLCLICILGDGHAHTVTKAKPGNSLIRCIEEFPNQKVYDGYWKKC
jgi:hypothetical protein